MKKNILIAISLFSNLGYAEDCILNSVGLCEVLSDKITMVKEKEASPTQFKESKIQRKLKNGKVQEFDGTKYKIVPREQVKYKVIPEIIYIKPPVIVKNRKHRIMLMVGAGPSKRVTTTIINPKHVVMDHGPEGLVGLQYSQDFMEFGSNKTAVWNAQILSNETYMVGIGVGF